MTSLESPSLITGMERIRLYDTLSREVRELEQSEPGRFRMYVCGPTVYGPAHIGNFITFVRFDVLFRLLKLAGYNPFYVRNITDVDDKTIRGAAEAGLPLHEFTANWADRFQADCRLLNLLPPDREPTATGNIEEQIELVRKLMNRGFAYVGGDGSVYYRVDRFEPYGALSHFDPQALRSQGTTSGGTANLSDEYDRDAVADFALWKSRKEGDGPVFWESPWGPGRPGWHLECSAMSLKFLGNSFDLHGGGEDLCFPHHENEIAQSEAATGKEFARHWMHSVHLLVEGKKMSKSLGNFFVLSDLTDKGFHPVEIRLAFLGGHYRQQFNFTLKGLEDARSGLGKLESGIEELLTRADLDKETWSSFVRPVLPSSWGELEPAWEAFSQDLNTPAVLGALFNGLKQAARSATDSSSAKSFLEGAGALFFALGVDLFSRPAGEEVPDEIEELARTRWEAKKAKAFAEADALREQIVSKGWLVEDGKDGYVLSRKH